MAMIRRCAAEHITQRCCGADQPPGFDVGVLTTALASLEKMPPDDELEDGAAAAPLPAAFPMGLYANNTVLLASRYDSKRCARSTTSSRTTGALPSAVAREMDRAAVNTANLHSHTNQHRHASKNCHVKQEQPREPRTVT